MPLSDQTSYGYKSQVINLDCSFPKGVYFSLACDNAIIFHDQALHFNSVNISVKND